MGLWKRLVWLYTGCWRFIKVQVCLEGCLRLSYFHAYIYIYMLIAQVLFSYQEFCEVFLVCYGAYEQ